MVRRCCTLGDLNRTTCRRAAAAVSGPRSTVAATGLGGTAFGPKLAAAAAVPGGAARRRRRHAATPPCCRAAAVVSCQKPTATATGLGGTAFRSTACCRRRRRGAACGGGGTAFGSTACCRCRRRRGAACGGGGSARGNPPRFLASHPPDPVLRFTLYREGLLTAHCSLLIAHCSTLIALYPTQPQDSTAARAPPHLAACAPHPPSMGPAHTGASPLPPTAFSTAPSRGCPHCIHSAPFPAFLVT